jgi:hypothetical protein
LLLLIVMYWLLLAYPVFYRIYTRAKQGTLEQHALLLILSETIV